MVSFEYTNLMRSNLEEAAVALEYSPGMGLMKAVQELKAIRSRNVYPARFQLLLYVEKQPHVHESQTTYMVCGPVSNKNYSFTRLAAFDDIGKITSKELKLYAEWLTERAVSLDNDDHREPSYYNRVFSSLIEKNCWMRYRDSDQRYLKRTLTRHYAYEMGHYLGFTLEEMQGFISRVLPDEVFLNKDPEDLAEAYAFNQGLSFHEVQHILDVYNSTAPMNDLYEVIDIGNTHQLYDEASTFEGTKEEFIEWLTECRPVLEGRSRTSFKVYQNLLICAYMMMKALYETPEGLGADPVGELWTSCIENGEDMLEYYRIHHTAYRLPEFAQIKWKKAAGEFNAISEWAPSENRERRYPRDFLVYLSIDKNGEFVTENTFTRIPLIMEKGNAVQKRDILCLIWQIYIFAWESVAPEDVGGQLRDFIDLATGILEQCNFVFYLPNLLEYSICRSLIIGGDMEDSYRSVISQGEGSPLCEDLCIHALKTDHTYGIRFYACEEYTFDQIKAVLYDVAKGERIAVYDDEWKDIELWVTKADQRLQCGWDRIEDPKVIESIKTLDRMIDLPETL